MSHRQQELVRGAGCAHPLVEGPGQAGERGKVEEGEKPSSRTMPPSSRAASTWCPLPALSKVLPDTGQKRGWGDGFQGQALGLESSQTQSHAPVVRAHLGHRQSPWEALGLWSDWFPRASVSDSEVKGSCVCGWVCMHVCVHKCAEGRGAGQQGPELCSGAPGEQRVDGGLGTRGQSKEREAG